ASEVAMEGGWKQQYGSTYADTPLLMPPSAQQFVMAADLDLARLHPRWQAAVMRLGINPSKELIARNIGGEPGELAGLDVISTATGGMIVRFEPNIFGLRQPGDRQTMSRWIRETKSGAGGLSPYLQAAANVPDRVGTEIIMAIDLTDAVSPERVEERMSQSAVLQDSSIDHEAAAEAIASLRGLMLGARVTNRVHGVLRIDFDRDVTVLSDVAKPLFLETLGDAGAAIDEFANWEVKVGDKRISLEGDLTQDGLRRLFSFLEIDATAVDADEAKAESSDDPQAPSVDAYTSLQYFQSIARHLKDLKRERGASSYYTIAVWFDKYARRIDRLPILHVDKDLVEYGKRTVGQLRNCVDAIRGAGISSGARSAQVTGSVGYDGYSYDPYTLYGNASSRAQAQVGAVEAERRAIRRAEQGQSSMDVRGIIRQIEDDTSTIRRQMTERYNIEFEDIPRRPIKQ
ncbi:MAG TPA: hypothetical protein VGK58_05705, partial [Lacipirellulaceae bacterium]